MWVLSLGQEDPLEEGMATHSSILAWRIPWTEEPGRLQPIGLQRVRHNWSDLACTHTTISTQLCYLWIEKSSSFRCQLDFPDHKFQLKVYSSHTSLHCPPETITTLLIGYTPIQNKKFKGKKTYSILLSHRKEWHNATSSNREGPRERQISYHLHVESKTQHEWTHAQNRDRPKDTEKRLVVAKGVQSREGWGVWDYQMQNIIYRMDRQQEPPL